MDKVILDVRDQDEFRAGHVVNSINIPLSNLALSAPGFFKEVAEREVILICRSGTRACMAFNELKRLGIDDSNIKVAPGGILAWNSAERPIIHLKKAKLPIMRQVQLIAGILILSMTSLGAFVNSNFLLGAGFVGAGLTIAGLTGFCGMALLLEKMPWNK